MVLGHSPFLCGELYVQVFAVSQGALCLAATRALPLARAVEAPFPDVSEDLNRPGAMRSSGGLRLCERLCLCL